MRSLESGVCSANGTADCGLLTVDLLRPEHRKDLSDNISGSITDLEQNPTALPEGVVLLSAVIPVAVGEAPGCETAFDFEAEGIVHKDENGGDGITVAGFHPDGVAFTAMIFADVGLCDFWPQHEVRHGDVTGGLSGLCPHGIPCTHFGICDCFACIGHGITETPSVGFLGLAPFDI